DFCALGCRLGGLDRLHYAEPVLVKEERVFAEQLVELCNHGVFVGNNARFELTQGLLDLCGVEFHRALLFQACSKASPRDNRGLRASYLEVVKRYLRSLRTRPSDTDRTQRARCA